MSTIKVDTVRPVTADASLTLQGDNSGTGVSGITIDSSGNATFAGTGNNLGTVTAGTISGGTIGSSVTFPAGNCIAIHTTTSNNTQSTTSGDNYLTFGTVTTQKNNSKIVCSVSTRIYKVAGSIDVCIFLGTGLIELVGFSVVVLFIVFITLMM